MPDHSHSDPSRTLNGRVQMQQIGKEMRKRELADRPTASATMSASVRPAAVLVGLCFAARAVASRAWRMHGLLES